MRTCVSIVSVVCAAFETAGCLPIAGPAASSDSEILSAVVSKAEDIAQLIGPSGFGGPEFSGYQPHMGPMMGFRNADALADANGTVRVQLWNQAGVPCTFHLAYLESYGDLAQVGTPAGTLGSGAQLGDQFCVPGLLNSDCRCGGTFACFLSPDTDDLDGDRDTQGLVITTQPFQQHLGPTGMMGHRHMMDGWR